MAPGYSIRNWHVMGSLKAPPASHQVRKGTLLWFDPSPPLPESRFPFRESFFLHFICHLFNFHDHVWMMNMISMDSATESDEQLWRLACEGDREAFTRIVERYQTLVCSLAYSTCGALGMSEDMAQETFITAWHRLKDLREPGKLRQWLCGIVRNIAKNAVRRELRRGGVESLETVADPVSSEDDPAAQA